MPPPQTQPLAGTAFPQTQPPQIQTQSLVLQAPPQLPWGDLGDDDDDDEKDNEDLDDLGDDDDDDEKDYEDLDERAVLGEESFAEEEAQAAERQHQDDDTEAEEREFMRKVAAVGRVHETHKRYGVASALNPRCRQAVGGGAEQLGSEVHNCAIQFGEGVEFTLASLREGCSFVAIQNYNAITRRHEVMKHNCQDWPLLNDLPDTDGTGTSMSDETFTSRWQCNRLWALKHLMKTRGGIG